VTGDEKWIFYDNLKKKKYYTKLRSIVAINLNINITAEHSWFEDHALYLVGPKGSCLYAAETWRFHYRRSVSATIDSFESLREKRSEYEQRHDKVILLHDNARLHVIKVIKKYSETLKWDLSYPLYSLDIGRSDTLLVVPKDSASHRFTSFAEIDNWLQN